MTLKTPFEIRDPVHGLIRLTEQEMRIVDTRAFQRLRRIRQLAMADLVYPGALHTRFEHSLGVLHVTHLILRRLERELEKSERLCDKDARVIRLAALLHDVGHGPFSHVSEELFSSHVDGTFAGEKIHEQLTLDVVRWSDIAECLDPGDATEIERLIFSTHLNDFRRQVISSNLDADKMDYLLRDSYFTGVKYGTFDLEKIVEALMVYRSGEGDSEESYLVIGEDGRFAVEQLVVAKHHMTWQVYAHRVRVITDSMIIRGLNLAICDGADEIKTYFNYEESQQFVEKFLKYDDESLVRAILADGGGRAASIFRRLRERKLFKQVSVRNIDKSMEPDRVLRMRLQNLFDNDAMRKRLESEVAEALGCEEWEVIVAPKSIANPMYPTPLNDPSEVMVVTKDGTSKSLDEFWDVLDAKVPGTRQIHIIGAVEDRDWSDYEKQKRLRDRIMRLTDKFLRKGEIQWA